VNCVVVTQVEKQMFGAPCYLGDSSPFHPLEKLSGRLFSQGAGPADLSVDNGGTNRVAAQKAPDRFHLWQLWHVFSFDKRHLALAGTKTQLSENG